MFKFKRNVVCLVIWLLLLSGNCAVAFKPVPKGIDKYPFNKLYNKFINTLQKGRLCIDVERFFVHYIKRCPCSDDIIEQIALIIDALNEANADSTFFELLLFQEQTYYRIIKIEDNNLRLREFIKFMETDRFRFNKWHMDLLFNSRLPELIIDEENHNIKFKVKLREWGNNIYITFSLKRTIDMSINDSYAKI